jgi:prepilin-type N-terminal cleavage/methylation domain-containing protein
VPATLDPKDHERVKLTRTPDRSAGFTLAEVVVGMALFAVLVVAGLGLLLQTTNVAGQNVRRTTAANLLTRRIEAARATTARNIPDSQQVATAVVGGTTYTLTQDTKYVSDKQLTSICEDTSGNLLYKLVTVTVTWPEMEAVKPVRGDTLKAVGLGSDGSAAANGALVVTVRDDAGDLVAGAEVDVADQTQITGDDGCAVFVDLAPNTYTGSAAGAPGSPHDGQYGTIDGSQVQAGQVSRTTVTISPPPPPPPPAPSPTGTDGSSGGSWDGGSSTDSGGGSGTGDSSSGDSSSGGSSSGDSTSAPPPPPPPPPMQAS